MGWLTPITRGGSPPGQGSTTVRVDLTRMVGAVPRLVFLMSQGADSFTCHSETVRDLYGSCRGFVSGSSRLTVTTSSVPLPL